MPEKELDNLSPSQRALLAIRELRARLEAVERERTEPIAIIGMGCRFPAGGHGPEAFWRLLKNGVDAIREVPPDRWDLEEYYDPDPDAPGKMYCRYGSFLEDIDKFDARFFGISPREAVGLDPQQRLLLETTWQALEHASLAPDKLNGSLTGVFIGISTNDYGQLQARNGSVAEIDAHSSTGNALSIASGRLSYFFGFQGPSLAVDTACSSSLVTVHLACQALRNRECNLAVAGGVSVILAPEINVALCKSHMLAPDGRCKTFDAAADGYVRGEGCGLVVLKRLQDALADGDNILALIRGSAVNQDGRSNGLTAPNGRAQVAVMRRSLESAGVAPAEIDYLEAHGTGTALGDPIEMRSIIEVMCTGRAAHQPLYVGSVKTNLGHLEPAAGIAGLIKTVLALQHEEIPPHLHFKQLNPHIDLSGVPVVVTAQAQPWPQHAKPRLAAVNSFGFSGTNANVVLQEWRGQNAEPQPTPGREQDKREPALSQVRPAPAALAEHLLTLSAKSDIALQELAAKYEAYLAEQNETAFADICHTTRVGRAHLDHRLAVVADSPTACRAALAEFATGRPSTTLVSGRLKSSSPPSWVFLFTGQGAQYVGMGRRLYETQPVFRAALEKCEALLQPHLEKSLLAVMFNEPSSPQAGHLLDQTVYTQPALFALEYALAELWKAWGIEPAAVMGHSVGEYVAACVAGVFSLEDGLKLIASRGRLMQALPPEGDMAAVFAEVETVKTAIAPYAAVLDIAAVNAPENVVISGQRQALATVLAQLESRGIQAKRLNVSHAFHSPLMAPMLASFEAVLREVSLRPPELTLISNVTGKAFSGGEIPDASYWCRHVRATVLFAESLRTAHALGYRHFLEIGPSPTLLNLAAATLPEQEICRVASLKKGRDEHRQILEAAATLYVNGAAFDWSHFTAGQPCRRVILPTYAFQRQRYWIDRPLTGGEKPSEWFYEIAWQEKPLPATAQANFPTANWLILTDRSGLGEALAKALQQKGQRCWLVDYGSTFQQLAPQRYCVNPANAEDFERLLQALAGAPLAVVHLWSLDAVPTSQLNAASIEYTPPQTWGGVLSLAQRLSNHEQAKLWLITRGGQAVNGEPSELHLAAAPLLGLGRAMSVELPALWGGMVDVDFTASDESAVAALLDNLLQTDGEDQVVLRGGRRLVARLVRKPVAPGHHAFVVPGDNGTIMITGGLGGLGLQVAQWLVQHGAKNLVLISRRSPSSAAEQVIAQLKSRGVQVMVAAADVADEVQLATLLDEIRYHLPPLRGVIHAAGVVDDGVIVQQDWTRFHRVLAPKVKGGWNLHELTLGEKLDFFVMFSSAASVLQAAGQSNYAAANAFLDQLAHHRQRLGLPALTINWGPWSEAGMAVVAGEKRDRQRRSAGLQSLSPRQGLQALEWLLGDGSATQVAVLRMAWQQFARQLGARRLPPLLTEVVTPAAETTRPANNNESLRPLEKFKTLAAHQRREFIAAYLRDTLARILDLNVAEITPERSIFELGLDSLMAMELANYLQRDFDYKLSVREVHRRPTIGAMIDYLTLALNQREGMDTPAAEGAAHSLINILRPRRTSFPKVTKRNPSMIFLLSCPRSGSTLFRVMLAGHPRLFAPPELHLLLFGTMREWHDALRLTVLGEGLQRAFMELKKINADQAKELIADLVAQDLPTQQVYAMLQELAFPRLLVDKSPTYVSDFEALRRAEQMFDQPRYLFLFRHPYAMVESYLRNEMGTISLEHSSDRQLHAELMWANGNSNAIDFGELVGSKRFHYVRYEDMVAEPERITAGICEFLGLEYNEALVNPYSGNRMTDGLNNQVLSIGDPNFHKHDKIDKSLGEAWRRIRLEQPLCSFARRVAKDLGYELPENAAGAPSAEPQRPAAALPALVPTPREGNLPLSFAQQRLWFLEQFQPGNPMYNIPLTLRLHGELDVPALEQALNEIVRRHESLRTTFADQAGEPVQRIADKLTIPLQLTDLQAIPAAEREAEALRRGHQAVRAPFDFRNGPLIRFELLRLAPQDHLLLMPMHHIISDGWSLGIITRELGVLYNAFRHGQSSPLPDLNLHYVDYAIWQRQWLSGENLAQQVEYWRTALGDKPTPLQLPTDRPRPAIMTANGRRHYFAWPAELAEQVRAFSREQQVTPFMTLLAAFKVLLQRYTGSPDIVVGSPTANRNHPGLEGIVGFFVNNLVLRTNLGGDPSFVEIVQRVREVTLSAYQHQDVPFEKLVEVLQVERDPSRSPLFQVMFVLQNMELELPEMDGLRVSAAPIDSGTAKFDLRLSVYDQPEGLAGNLEYNTDLFDDATIARLLEHYRTILSAVVSRPQLRLAEIPLLSPAERQQMLLAWNNTHQDFPADRCLHHLFEAQVEKTPEAVAIVFGAQKLSYAELNRRANRVAHHLQSLGVGSEVLVGIYVERSLEMVIGLLGILKAGGAYVPLDPHFPAERLAMMLEDSAAPVLLTQEKLLASLPPHQAQVVCLESLFKQNGSQNGAAHEWLNPLCHVAPHHLAYVLFTSGSTGRPKGVQIEHRSVVNFLTSMAQQPGFTSSDVLLAVTTLSFDIAGLELYLPLVTGGRVVLADAVTAADGAALLRLLHESHATIMQATPATWRLLLAAGWHNTPGLKILCGGEALPGELAKEMLDRCAELWNMYGPTETTIWSSLLKVESTESMVPIGRPIANTEMYIVDAHLNPVPIGVPGELLIGGAGLSRGYLKRPELTAEKFIAHPFSDEKAARVYRTGDLCRYRRDGVIEFLGRLDQQVKVRGFRIELGDIESALAQHAAVQAVVVMARTDASGENRLVAYLIPAGEAPAASELRAFLKARLPEYMIPSAFVFLDSFPLTPNGKVNRRALPEPEISRSEADAGFVSPRTQLEEQIAAIWQEVLHLERVGVHDNFFELGGHSLLATQVVARLQQAMAINLPVRVLFEAKTVAELAQRIETIRWASGKAHDTPEERMEQWEEIEI